MLINPLDRCYHEFFYYLKYNKDYLLNSEWRDRYKKNSTSNEKEKFVPVSPQPAVAAPIKDSFEAHYLNLMQKCSEMIREIDVWAFRTESEETRDICSVIAKHLIEDMSTSSPRIILISNDKHFNSLLHDAVPSSIVDDGAAIAETLRPGIKLGDRVFVRAKVRLSEYQNEEENPDGKTFPDEIETDEDFLPKHKQGNDNNNLSNYCPKDDEKPKYEQIRKEDNSDDELGSFEVASGIISNV